MISFPLQRNMPIAQPRKEKGSCAQRQVPVIVTGELLTSRTRVEISPIARAARIQGTVVMRLTLDDTGGVKDADAITGAELLVRDCLINAKKWRFRPNAQRTAVIIYQFTMPGGECKSVSGIFMFKGPNRATIIGCDVPVETAR